MSSEENRAIRIVETYKEFDHLAVLAGFPTKDPEKLFRYFVDPALISKWWGPQIAQIEATQGGSYVLGWTKQNWFLRGVYNEHDIGKLLEFTWNWDHEPTEPETRVRIEFGPSEDGGTRLTLTHGKYSEKDSELRKGHLDGWLYFLPKINLL